MKLSESLKINIFSKGIGISDNAANILSNNGQKPFALHEYTTTGGVNLILEGDTYINAPLDEPFFQNPDAILNYDKGSDSFFVSFQGHEVMSSIIPFPGYLEAKDSKNRPVTASVFSHTDPARVSPIYGCTMSCKFCDITNHKYVNR